LGAGAIGGRQLDPAQALALAGDGQEADDAAGTRAVSQKRSGIVIRAQ